MRKTILISLLVFLIVAGSCFTIFWFIQASQIKKTIIQAIANLNQPQTVLTYDSIETSGFPSNVYVTIVHPRFSGRIDTLVQAFTAKAGMPKQQLPEWNEQITLNGGIVIGINALSDRYSISTGGDWQESGSLGDLKTAITAKAAGNSACFLEMRHSGGMFASLWDFAAFTRDAQSFGRDFKTLDCSFPANTISNAGGEKLAGGDAGRIFISNILTGDRRDARIYVSSASEITPAGDALVTLYRQAFTPGAGSFGLAAQGRQTIDLDAGYAGLADWQPTSKNPPLDIRINKFSLTNNLYNIAINANASNAMNGSSRAMALKLKATATFTDQYAAATPAMLHDFIRHLYEQKSPATAGVTTQFTPDQLYAIIAPAMPDLHSLGTLTKAIDLTYQGNPELTQGDITLNDAELTATPYGITAKGTGKLTPGLPRPAANVTLACANCAAMIDDMAAYAIRLKAAMTAFNSPAAAHINTNPALAAGVKTFLSTLSPDFTYAIVSDGKGAITINNKRPDEVLALYQQTVAPVLAMPAP